MQQQGGPGEEGGEGEMTLEDYLNEGEEKKPEEEKKSKDDVIDLRKGNIITIKV